MVSSLACLHIKLLRNNMRSHANGACTRWYMLHSRTHMHCLTSPLPPKCYLHTHTHSGMLTHTLMQVHWLIPPPHTHTHTHTLPPAQVRNFLFPPPPHMHPTTLRVRPHCHVWCPWLLWLLQGEVTTTWAFMERILVQCTHSLTVTPTISLAPLCCPLSREANPPCLGAVARTSEGSAQSAGAGDSHTLPTQTLPLVCSCFHIVCQ